jgi:hypothetical protein
LEPTTYSSFTEPVALDFDEGGVIQLTYSYKVTAVNSDGIESDYSNVVQAIDVVDPTINAGNTVLDTPMVDPGPNNTDPYTLTIDFGEPMDEESVETLGNYQLTLDIASGGVATDIIPVITGVTYDPGTYEADFTLTLTAPAAGYTYQGFWLMQMQVLDVAGNTLDIDDDMFYFNNGGWYFN